MTPARILAAIRLGETALSKKHAALDLLWRKFGASVRETRHARKIPLKDFAAALGITPAFTAMLESGTRHWGVERAGKAVEILNEAPAKA